MEPLLRSQNPMTEFQHAETTAYAQTVEHIALVQKLLLSAQVELSRRIVTHDQSKLRSPEWEMFREVTAQLRGLTYGSDEYKAQLQKMKTDGALGHHYAHNRHHPEFFDLHHPEDGINKMNLFDLLEMLIDWIAAVHRHDDGNIHRSIEINKERFGMSDQLTQVLTNTVGWISDEFVELNTQKDLELAGEPPVFH